jgi:hypothetical protein
MIEALACGTPVIAFGRGSVPEVVDDGVTGFVVHNVDEAVRALDQIGDFSRRTCHDVFERRFDAMRMARDYVDVYRRTIQSWQLPALSGQRSAISQTLSAESRGLNAETDMTGAALSGMT